MIDIKYKVLNNKAVVPSTGSDEAAAFDLVITEVIPEGSSLVTVKYGFATSIPPGYKGVIVPRSSFTHKGWVMQNSPGQIDSDYRGEWMSKFERVSDLKPFPYSVGTRVTQCFFEKVIPVNWIEEELEETERGTGGFGSTGIN